MYAKYRHPDDNYMALLYESHSMDAGRYTISLHRGEMPAFNRKTFASLARAKTWAKNTLGITHWRGFDGRFTARPD